MTELQKELLARLNAELDKCWEEPLMVKIEE